MSHVQCLILLETRMNQFLRHVAASSTLVVPVSLSLLTFSRREEVEILLRQRLAYATLSSKHLYGPQHSADRCPLCDEVMREYGQDFRTGCRQFVEDHLDLIAEVLMIRQKQKEAP